MASRKSQAVPTRGSDTVYRMAADAPLYAGPKPVAPGPMRSAAATAVDFVQRSVTPIFGPPGAAVLQPATAAAQMQPSDPATSQPAPQLGSSLARLNNKPTALAGDAKKAVVGGAVGASGIAARSMSSTALRVKPQTASTQVMPAPAVLLTPPAGQPQLVAPNGPLAANRPISAPRTLRGQRPISAANDQRRPTTASNRARDNRRYSGVGAPTDDGVVPAKVQLGPFWLAPDAVPTPAVPIFPPPSKVAAVAAVVAPATVTTTKTSIIDLGPGTEVKLPGHQGPTLVRHRLSAAPSGGPVPVDPSIQLGNPAATSYPPLDGVMFAESPDMPGGLVVYRTQEARSLNPEQLNLDKRNLEVCPYLEGEHRLRLLNYQHNRISQLMHLHNLPNLIFLDLYNNSLTSLNGLDALTGLRVLMLGKNKIQKIENLDALVRLDVLDLHSNHLTRVENLSHLTGLRVLNLAGNQIRTVESLTGLLSLTELNLRRNRLQSVYNLHLLPSLLRLFLSNNDIVSFDSIRCVFRCPCLVELAIDGNPFVLSHAASYRQHVICRMPGLKQLDLRRVTPDERRAAEVFARKTEEQRKEQEQQEQVAGAREAAIRSVQTAWAAELRKRSLAHFSSWTGADPKPGIVSDDAEQDAASLNESDVELDGDGLTDVMIEDDGEPVSQAAAAAAAAATARILASKPPALAPHGRPVSPTAGVHALGTVARQLGQDSAPMYWEVDKEGTEPILSIYGPAFVGLDDPKQGRLVSVVAFNFVDFQAVLESAAWRLATMPRLKELRFQHNELANVSQLYSLARKLQGRSITKISISANPVGSSSLFRPVLVASLPTLTHVNDTPVTDEERNAAVSTFGAVFQLVEDGPLDPKVLPATTTKSTEPATKSTPSRTRPPRPATAWRRPVGDADGAADPAAADTTTTTDVAAVLRRVNVDSVTQAYALSLATQAVATQQRMQLLHVAWPDFVQDLIAMVPEDICRPAVAEQLQAQLEGLLDRPAK